MHISVTQTAVKIQNIAIAIMTLPIYSLSPLPKRKPLF